MFKQSLIICCLFLIAANATNHFVREFSYHVSVQFRGKHECSGSIINNRHILTASPCVISTSAKDLSILAGTTSLRQGGVSYKVEDIILHDNAFSYIALLRTRDKIDFSSLIYKIDISNFYNIRSNTEIVVTTAWEKPLGGGTRKNNKLRRFSYKFFDAQYCMKESQPFQQLYMCTFDCYGQDSSNMDYGGAIVANGKQIGVNLNDDADKNGFKYKSHIFLRDLADWIHLNSDLTNLIYPPEVTTIPGSYFNNNHEAPYGSNPHHVSVRRNNEHICSGSIINERFIITSQLCVIKDRPADLNVVVGTNSLATYPGILYEIEKIIGYNGDDDFIALLQTKKNIEFNKYTQPIAITNVNYEADGYPVTFTAFEQPISGIITKDKLQEFHFEIYGLKNCNKYYNERFDQSTLCTSNPSRENICNMDYGGGVVLNKVLIGMKLYNVKKCDNNQPQINIRIPHYYNWIRNKSDISKISYSHTPSNGKVTTSFQFGNYASVGQFPYHVSIKRSNQHICSGSIINERHILTSNNCVSRNTAKDLFVIAGTNSLKKSGQLYKIDKIIPTDDYNYDIALLRTTNKIIFNEDVRPIKIVPPNYSYSSAIFILTAWERSVNGEHLNDKLQQISYRMSDRKRCKQNTPHLNEVYMCSIRSSQGNGCNMDYGAPIVSNGYQIAMNPFAVKCDGNDQTQLHLPLLPLSEWIKRNSRI